MQEPCSRPSLDGPLVVELDSLCRLRGQPGDVEDVASDHLVRLLRLDQFPILKKTPTPRDERWAGMRGPGRGGCSPFVGRRLLVGVVGRQHMNF